MGGGGEAWEKNRKAQKQNRNMSAVVLASLLHEASSRPCDCVSVDLKRHSEFLLSRESGEGCRGVARVYCLKCSAPLLFRVQVSHRAPPNTLLTANVPDFILAVAERFSRHKHQRVVFLFLFLFLLLLLLLIVPSFEFIKFVI